MIERTKMISQTAVRMLLKVTATLGDSFLLAIKMISVRSKIMVRADRPTYTAATALCEGYHVSTRLNASAILVTSETTHLKARSTGLSRRSAP